MGWLHTTASLGPWKGWQAGVVMFSPGFPCRRRNGSRDRAGEDVNISQVPCLAGMRGGVKPEARSEHQFLQEPTVTGKKMCLRLGLIFFSAIAFLQRDEAHVQTPFFIYRSVFSDSVRRSLNSEWLNYLHCFSAALLCFYQNAQKCIS